MVEKYEMILFTTIAYANKRIGLIYKTFVVDISRLEGILDINLQKFNLSFCRKIYEWVENASFEEHRGILECRCLVTEYKSWVVEEEQNS